MQNECILSFPQLFLDIDFAIRLDHKDSWVMSKADIRKVRGCPL